MGLYLPCSWPPAERVGDPVRGRREEGLWSLKNKEPGFWRVALLPGAEECPRAVLCLHPHGDLRSIFNHISQIAKEKESRGGAAACTKRAAGGGRAQAGICPGEARGQQVSPRV